MAAYRVIWRLLCGVLITAGVVIGVVVLPLKAWMLAGLVAVILAFVTVISRSGSPKSAGTSYVGTLLSALTVGLATVAVLGLGAVLHASVVFLVLLVAACSPFVIGRLLSATVGRTASWRPGSSTQRRDVSTRQLCREWHESYLSLRQAATPADRLRIVRARQRCLDELERRDPEGLQAWLASNASAGGDPSRFLTDGRSDWPPDQQLT